MKLAVKFSPKNPPGKMLFVAFFLIALFFITNNDRFLVFGRNICQESAGEYASLRCFVDYYTDKTAMDGPESALDDLKTRYTMDLVPRCHQLAHAIGRASEKLSTTIGEAFQHGDPVCTSGYYHGVMESYAALNKEVLEKERINEICLTFRKRGELVKLYNCAHGLGHGIMDVTYDNLFMSLEYCAGITALYEQIQCLGGVFMENTTADGKDHISRNFAEDDIFHPCTAVKEEYKKTCYFRQPRHILNETNWDFAQSFAHCGALENSDYRKACYRGLGREADDIDNPYRKEKISICTNAPSREAQEECVTGTVLPFFPNLDEARVYCGNFAPSLAKYCEDISISAFTTLISSP